MLVGFTFNIFLFGMMTTQIYLYYTNFRRCVCGLTHLTISKTQKKVTRDRLWMKLFVRFIASLSAGINSLFTDILHFHP